MGGLRAGCGKGRSMNISANFRTNSQLFYRMYEERVMLLAGRSDKLINEDKFHLGDEVLFSAHSSPMVPKESPMKVI